MNIHFNKALALVFFLIVTVGMMAKNTNNLRFDVQKFTQQTISYQGQTMKVRAYENIEYVQRPVDTAYQKMNIYIPEAYFESKTINGYTAQSAPIFFPNKVGGYMPAKPASLSDNPMGMRPPINGEMPSANAMPSLPNPQLESKPLTIVVALMRGYVVASAGARGRTLSNADGAFTGKAPAGLVDLKAAIRYLKYNNKRMPGDATKLVSNGTSAGGAMSALLGATANNPVYEPYLKELGAAKASDAVFAVSAYCPITNLEHADMAYEWQFNGINSYTKGGPMARPNAAPQLLTEAQIKVSNELKTLFPAYLNSLDLRNKQGNMLRLDAQGNGNFKELIASYIIASAQKELDHGADLSKLSFLTIADKKVIALDYEKYIHYIGRQKTPPAFDALDLSSPETNLFGTSSISNQHFTDYSQKNSIVNGTRVDEAIVRMMNPMNFVGAPKTTTANHWRIRHGASDKDTSFAIAVMLATLLENRGFDVNLELPWGKAHSGDYDLNELFDWVDALCK